MTNQWDPDGIFDVLANDESQRILAAASVRPVSAQELETVCEASLPTIYRRINVLLRHDLLSAEQVVDSERGQYKRYTTDLREITVTIEDGGFNVNVEVRKDTVEKFGELFRDLGEGHLNRRDADRSGFRSGSPTEE